MFSSMSSLLFTLAMGVELAFAVNVPKPESNAAATCFNWAIIPNTASLSAICFTTSGDQRNTNIALSQCVGNQNGHIGCQAGGGAGASCIFTNIQAGQTFLNIDASCLDRAGNRIPTSSFNLDNCLSNINGNLGC
ncbi:hypothetical protein BJ912DRAFT_1032377 [Pholiota molesta]|nr:hypothetical protein BJ912DRAFT_1032377 [Pholiota molesta]